MSGYTAAELSYELGLDLGEGQMFAVLRHLRRHHDLNFHRQAGEQRYTRTQVREALDECQELCGKALTELIGGDVKPRKVARETAASLSSSRKISMQQEIDHVRKMLGLMTVKDIGAKHGRNASERASGQPLVTYLRDRGLQPARKIGRVGLYSPKDVEAVMRRFCDETPKRRTKSDSSIRSTSSQSLIDAKCRSESLVTSGHIANAYARNIGPGDRNNFMIRLRAHGLQYVLRIGRSFLYRPEDVEAVTRGLGLRRVNAWPDWIP